jgi:two-component system, cell cycle sensor histidine kinase and response regulator CckA
MVLIAIAVPVAPSLLAIALLPAATAVWWRWGTQLGRAELALGDSQARKAAVLEVSPEAVVAVDSDGRVLEFNSAAERIFGQRRSEVLGCRFFDLIPIGRRRHCLEKAFHRLLQSNAVTFKRFQLKARRADGVEFPAELTIAKTVAASGPTVTGFIRDLSQWKRAEQAVRESERRFRETLESARLVAVWLDRDGRVTFCNDALLNLTGHDRSAMIGCDWFNTFVPGEKRESLKSRFIRNVRSGKLVGRFEEEVVCRTGERRLVAWTNTVLRDPDGNPVGASSLGEDVTEQRRAEAALRKSEALLRLVWDTAAEAMRLTDADGTVVLANPAYCRLIGRPAEELVGRPLVQAYAGPRGAEILRKHGERFATQSARAFFESAVELWDGRQRWFEVGMAFLNATDEPPLLLSVLRDVTDRKQADSALRESEERYRRLFEANPHPMWVYDTETLRFRAVNEAAVSRYGYTRDEFLAMKILDLLPVRNETDLQSLRTPGDTSQTALWQHQWKDGTIRDVQLTSHALQDSDHSARLVLAMDVTERKRAEATLAERALLAGLAAEVGAAISRVNELGPLLQDTANAIITHLGAAFARIWLVNELDQVLELCASAGRPIVPSGNHSRIPIGRSKVGSIARDAKPYATNDAVADPNIDDPDWIHREKLTAFAGYPLAAAGRVVGVLALFSTRSVSDAAFAALDTLAAGLAQAVERRRAEAALRESEERFRRLFEDSPIGIYRTTPDGRFLLANPAAVRMAGCATLAELAAINLEADSPVAGYDRAQFKKRLETAEEVRGLESVWRQRDGETVYVRENARAVRRLDGSVAYYEGTLEDITDRRRAESALREREELLRNVLTHIPGGVFWKDRESVYLGCNDLVARNSSLDVAAIVGRTDMDLGFDAKEANFYRECDRRVMETGIPILNLEETQTRGDGKSVLLTSKVPLRDEAGTVVGVLGMYQDITDRKRLEEQLRHAQKMEAVGRLAGGIAHDFNNLLTVINGFSQVVLDQLGGEDPARPLVEEIGKAGDRAAGLTRQLLAFSRQQVVSPRVLDLNSVVAGTDRMIARLIGEDVLVATELALNLWTVKIDPGQVEQVLMNLVVNSRDAMPTGGRLTILTRNVAQVNGQPHSDVPAGNWVTLAVRDTGVGMDQTTQARVFEPFFTTKEVGKGTGLGLATVYGIVAQSAGHVTVESQLGQGTTFTIYLPRVTEEAAVRDIEHADGPLPQGSETILLVEDEPAVRALNRRVLESSGYRVLEASDGRQAVQMVDGLDGPLHLLVSDVVMPHLGGRQLAEQIHDLRPRLKVLFVSGYTDDEMVRHGIGSEFEFLQKPFTPIGLARKVRQVLDRLPF